MKSQCEFLSRSVVQLSILLCVGAFVVSAGEPEPIVELNDSDRVIGSTLAVGLDFNQDGVLDLFVGDPYFDSETTELRVGRVTVVDGSSGAILRIIRSPTEQKNGLFGTAVLRIGDMNGDGSPDLAVGAPGENPGLPPIYPGQVHIFDASSGALLKTLHSTRPDARGDFGIMLAPFNDPNAPGEVRFFVAEKADHVGYWVYLVDASHDIPVDTIEPPIFQPSGAHVRSMATVPDITGDGVDDLLLGRIHTIAGTSGGSVLIYSGSTGKLIRILEPPEDDEGLNFGWSVAGCPDIDSDGAPDFIVGAAKGDSPGIVFLFSGKTRELIERIESPGEDFRGRFGYSVSSVPDTTGDGIPEIGVGAPPTDGDLGRIFLFDGSTRQTIRTYFPSDIEDSNNFGNRVFGLEDLDGKSGGDIAVGGSDYGSGFLYLFRSPYTPPVARLTPAKLDFGILDLDRPSWSIRSVTLENLGGSNLALIDGEPLITGVGAEDFEIIDVQWSSTTSPSFNPLPPKACVRWDIRFDSNQSGPRIAEFEILTNDPVNSLQFVDLSGNGLRKRYPYQIIDSPEDRRDANFGTDVFGIEDISGDGLGDIVCLGNHWIQSPHGGGDNLTRICLIDGGSAEILRFLEPIDFGFQPFPAYSWAPGILIHSPSDSNGDGTIEVLLKSAWEPVYRLDIERLEKIAEYERPWESFWRTFGTAACTLKSECDTCDPLTVIGSSGDDSQSGISFAGRVHFYRASTGEFLFSVDSPNPQLAGEFGRSLTDIGDANSDGMEDLLVGAPFESSGGLTHAGRVYILDGSTGATLKTLQSPTPKAGGRFGYKVHRTDDLNGNGFEDFAVGFDETVPNTHSQPVFFFDGGTFDLIDTIESPYSSLARVPDTNFDGVDEFSFADRLFDGATGELIQDYDTSRYGVDPYQANASGLPDANGDGRGDMVVGNPYESGRIVILYTPTQRIEVDPTSLSFGSQVLDSGPTDYQSIAITNTGALDLRFQCPGIRLSGPDLQDFELNLDGWVCTSGASQTILRPDESLEVSVRFNPSLAGNREAHLVLETDDPFIPSATVPLRGFGITPSPTPTSTPTVTFTPGNAPPCDSGYYVLDSYGGRHRVGNPALITGSIYFGEDIARDLEKATVQVGEATDLDLVVLDGAG
ncbi:MAG: FG-GAP repeat protein, partial [Candidatus Omnitrophica bacterium]|nr:FG-GAP repeat protein [Candidatus Omnitrophota bacterium]